MSVPSLDSLQILPSLRVQFSGVYKTDSSGISAHYLTFAIFQIVKIRLKSKEILKISVGTIYFYRPRIVFNWCKCGVYAGRIFQLGGILIKNNSGTMLVLTGMIMGYFVVAAEPAVFVLKRQVEEVTSGAISARAMGIGLSAGVAISVGLAWYGLLPGYILYFAIPGYVLALLLTFCAASLHIDCF